MISAAIRFFVALIESLWRSYQRDRALEEKGRAEGAASTMTEISEIADEQAHINAADRGGAAGVLDRLRRAGH
jgi:hypothetical protein